MSVEKPVNWNRGSATGESLNSGDPAVHPAARHRAFYVLFWIFRQIPESTNPGSMEAGGYGLTRGTWFFARSVEVAAVAGQMWVSWCVLGGTGFFRAFHEFAFSNS